MAVSLFPGSKILVWTRLAVASARSSRVGETAQSVKEGSALNGKSLGGEKLEFCEPAPLLTISLASRLIKRLHIVLV